MDDSTTTLTRSDRRLAAAWAARIVGVICLVLFLLFWPILVERHNSGPVSLSVACSKMVAHMRQQPITVGGADITQTVAHPECWSEQAAQ